MYELLKQYDTVGSRTLTVPEIREKLGLWQDEYPKWKDFRVRVLEPALEELPKKTDLRFSYTTRKKGRAIHWVDFKVWRVGAKTVSTARLKELKRQATVCATKTKSTCGATWDNHKQPTDSCHWCVRFDTQRAEAAGQRRLPLEAPKVEPERGNEEGPTEAEKKEALAKLAKIGFDRKNLERLYGSV
jgi:hypothetical protein